MVSARVRTSQILASLLSAFLYIPAAAQHARIPQQQEDTNVRQQQDADLRQQEDAGARPQKNSDLHQPEVRRQSEVRREPEVHQKEDVRPQEDARVRLASREEGEAIVEAAWELRHGLGEKPDCSHFVNAIYEHAGLEYDYARSTDLFEGIDGFRRVYRPQAGDLIVWRGHVGIVVDPEEHSFYSSVVTGFAIESYRSNYWLSRGHPRFYRYLIDETHRQRMLARRDPLR